MLPKDRPSVHCVEQALCAAPAGLELILMGDLNTRLYKLRDECEEYLATTLADQGMVNMTDHFLTRQQYQGIGGWKWSMQRDRQQVTGRGYYFLSTYRISFINTGLRETRHGTDHRVILAVLQGEGAIRNRRYRWGRKRWPIRPKSIFPYTKG